VIDLTEKDEITLGKIIVLPVVFAACWILFAAIIGWHFYTDTSVAWNLMIIIAHTMGIIGIFATLISMLLAIMYLESKEEFKKRPEIILLLAFGELCIASFLVAAINYGVYDYLFDGIISGLAAISNGDSTRMILFSSFLSAGLTTACLLIWFMQKALAAVKAKKGLTPPK